MKLRNTTFCLLLLCSTFLTPLYAQDDQQYLSPRISALAKELAAGNRSALDKFWVEVAKQGTPLIEHPMNSGHYRLVTFLWRGKNQMKWAQLLSDLTESNQELKPLLRLRNTDVWYRTVWLRNDARFVYGFVVDPGGQITSQARFGPVEPKTDPFNPRRALPGGFFSSLCELPGAPPQPWITRQPDVPAGRVEWKTFKSEILKNEREIGVYTPPDYQANGQPYALLFVFDGRTYTTRVPTPVILDNLLAKKLAPPLVAVFIANTKPSRRDEELPCNAGFADFLARELVPWVRQHYRVTTDPKQTIVAGSSSGGLAASFAAYRHPSIFGAVLSQSGSYEWKPESDNHGEEEEETEWLTKQFVAGEKLPVRFYLEAGWLESGCDPGIGNVSLLVANRHLRDVLRAKGYAVHYREFNGGHDYINWRGTFADGLLLLLGKDAEGKKDQ